MPTQSSSSRSVASQIECLEQRIAPAAFVVTTLRPVGPGSLGDVIEAANETPGADDITFAPGLKGSIKLLFDLPAITDDVTIAGPGASKLKIDGRDKTSIFQIEGEGLDITISGVTVMRGRAEVGGGIAVDNLSGTVTLEGVKITKNVAQAEIGSDSLAALGGGIFLGAGEMVIKNSAISGNVANGNGSIEGHAAGGGILVAQDGDLTIEATTVTGNRAIGAKGAAGEAGVKGANGVRGESGDDGTSGLNGTHGKAGANGGDAYGGGIFNLGTLEMRQSTVSGNMALAGQGGAGGKGGGGGAGGAGGAGYLYAGYRYPGGYGGFGGNGGNGADGGDGGSAFGGGIHNEGDLILERSTVSGNTAKLGAAGKAGLGGGGGAAGAGYIPSDSYYGESYSTNTNPTKGTRGVDGEAGTAGIANGGGISGLGGSMQLSQVTIAKNSTSNHGGGVALEAGAEARIANSTIAFNTAGKTGGGVHVEDGSRNISLEIVSSIISNNKAAKTALEQDLDGSIHAIHSLIHKYGASAVSGEDNILGLSAGLKLLAKNGSATATIMLKKNSLAIDTGANLDALSRDQRGRERQLGSGIDIGAVESL